MTVNIYVSTSDPGATAPGEGAPWILTIPNQYLEKSPAAEGYDTPDEVDMNGVEARYVGFEILETHEAGYRPGLSALRFYADPPSGTVIMIR